MTKEAKEFSRLLGSAVNSIYETSADGKVDFTDLGAWFDTIGLGQEGVKGFSLISGELATASTQEKQAIAQSFANELTAVDSQDGADMAAIINGVFSAWSLVARTAYEKGKTDAMIEMQAK